MDPPRVGRASARHARPATRAACVGLSRGAVGGAWQPAPADSLAGSAQDGGGFFDLGSLGCGQERQAAPHAVGDLFEGGDLSGQCGDVEFGGVRGLGGFAVGRSSLVCCSMADR